MYTVEMEDLLITVTGEEWESSIRLLPATSDGQRASNSKALMRGLKPIHTFMREDGATGSEREEMEAKVYEIIRKHRLRLI